jgi:ribosome-associated translation inhibitor RaiA
MEIPLQITFRAMPHSESLETQVRRRAAKLERIFQRLMSCRVVLEAAHRRRRHGKRYRVSIDLGLPRGEIAVSHAPGDDRNVEDAHAIVDEAFDEAFRRLEEWVRRQRGDVKRHPVARARERRLKLALTTR